MNALLAWTARFRVAIILGGRLTRVATVGELVGESRQPVEIRCTAVPPIPPEPDLVGTVQVILALPPNQPHRAEIAKLLVHRSARRRGIAQLLMERAESEARAEGKSLLVLDAVTGGEAARLYERLGWTRVGEIPRIVTP